MSVSKIGIIKLASLIIMFCLNYNLSAQNLPQNVSIHQLDNGLQLLLIQNQAMPMVGVNVVVKVGSAYETFASSGMSHMLEHLLFNGTTSRSQKELYDDTDRIGGYNNANTSEYYTNFMMVTPAEFIQKGMEIQADMLFHSTLPEQKFQKEKGIVLEEISKSLANSREQAERNIISLLYPQHALSLPTLGTYSTIEAMDRDQVFEFYKNNYVPNNMLISVIGNFNPAEMLKMVQNIYGQEAPGQVYREKNEDWALGFEPLKSGHGSHTTLHYRFYSGKQKQLQFFYPISIKASASFYGLLETRLKELGSALELQLKQDFAETVRSASTELRLSPVQPYLAVYLNIQGDPELPALKQYLARHIQSWKWSMDEQMLQAEMSAKRTEFMKNIEKPHMFGIYNAYDFAVSGIEAVLDSYGSETYRKAARELENFSLTSEPLVLFQQPLLQDQDTTKQQHNKARILDLGADHPTVIVKQNSSSGLLAIHYILGHKAPLEKEYGKNAAKVLHTIFSKRLQSAKNIRKSSSFGLSVKANDNPYIPMDDRYMNPDYGYIRVEATADDVPAVIRFLNEQMLNFIPSAEEFKQALAKLNRPNPMMMGSAANDAKKLFQKTYRDIIYEENPYADPPRLTDYNQLLAFSKIYFTPPNMIISIVSPASPEQIEPLFRDFSVQAKLSAAPVYAKQLRMQHMSKKIKKKGSGERSYLFYGFSKEIESSDRAALQALSLILSEKIVFDIREKQGLAYHMSAGISFSKDRALFYVNQGTRPENVDILMPQYPGFFKQNILDGVKEADLQKSLNRYLGRVMFRHLSSINQGYFLGDSYYFFRDINQDNKLLEALKKVSLQDVKRVAQKYLIPENEVTVVVR